MLSDPAQEAKIELEIKIAKEPWRGALLDAAELLRERGWCAGKFQSPKGERCAMGALHGVSFEPEITTHATTMHDVHAYNEAVARLRQHVILPVAQWNDKSDAETVIATLELVARS